MFQGDVKPGPDRWERARVSAEKHAGWKATKLYRDRQAVADLIEAGVDDDVHRGPYEHLNWNEQTREHATCSLRCTTLQLSLTLKSVDPDEIVPVLKGEPRAIWGNIERTICRPLDTSTLKRAITCWVCGTKIENADREKVRIVYRDREVRVEVPVPTPADLKLYVFTPIDEQICAAEDARIVPLTTGELTIFEGYVEPAARYRYALVYGRKLSDD